MRTIAVKGKQNKKVMEQLSACTRNVTQLTIKYSDNCKDWLTADVLRNWDLKEIEIIGYTCLTPVVMLILKTCTELTSIKLNYSDIAHADVIAIAQHCPKLETLAISSTKLTWDSLITLSERGLPLKELIIPKIFSNPTADIARRCSHALSCIPHLSTSNLHHNGRDANILFPYMTGLTSVDLDYYFDSNIPLLTRHCHKLTKITVVNSSDVLSLCRANPLLQELKYLSFCELADTALIELIHACPHLHTLCLSDSRNITDIGILALSEHCPQLQELDIYNCHEVTEAAVLQLLQRCHKLHKLLISSRSLSKETWTQLDKNTQKRVRRC